MPLWGTHDRGGGVHLVLIGLLYYAIVGQEAVKGERGSRESVDNREVR